MLLANLTPAVNVHQGQPLPIAKFIVIAVPFVLLSIFVWLRSKR